MNSQSNIPLKDLVLLGGGHAHVHVLKMLGMNPIQHLRVTLISRDFESPYSGMIPGFIAGYYTREECHIDICKLAGFANARFIHAEVYHIDVNEKFIFCSDSRPPIRYDLLSIDIGIIPKPLPSHISERLLQAGDFCVTPVKPIDRFAWKWETILQKFHQREITKPFRLVIVGGGAGGTELAFSVNYRLKSFLKSAADLPVHSSSVSSLVQITILNKNRSIMSKHSK
jgi:selenide,water dikinase